MESNAIASTRPNLKTKGFSVLHIEIFMMILVGKTNRDINKIMNYTQRSHMAVDHSRKVMYKLLALEKLPRREYTERVVRPRNYAFWWKKLLEQHWEALYVAAIEPHFY